MSVADTVVSVEARLQVAAPAPAQTLGDAESREWLRCLRAGAGGD